jgi:hypothetical protein
LSLVNPKYDPILNGRYLAPILPLCLAWVGLALEWLAWRRGPIRWPRTNASMAGRAGAWLADTSGVGLAAVLATALVVGSLGSLTRYYDDVRENARTGARILDVVRTAQALGQRAQPVVLDQRLDKVALGPGAGIILRVLRTTFELEGIEVQELWLGENRPAEVREGQLVVLASRSKPQFTKEAVTGLGLRDWRGGVARPQSQASLYGLYRFGPAALTTDAAKPGRRAKPASTPTRSPSTQSTPATGGGASVLAADAGRRR